MPPTVVRKRDPVEVQAHDQEAGNSAGTLTLTSYDDPQATIGVRGAVGISGQNINFYFPRAYVQSVDTSANTRGVVTYTTTVRLIDIGS